MEPKPFFIVDWLAGDLNALVKNLGEQNARDIAAGRVTIERVDDVLKLTTAKEKVEPFFNRYGFRIHPRGLKAATTKPNSAYYLTQPTLDYGQRLARIVGNLHVGVITSAAEFEARSKKILEDIGNCSATKNLLKGVHLPFALPQMEIADYGQVLDDVFLPAVERSYKQQFPSRSFVNYRKGDLAGQITIVEGSRHEKLIEAMKLGVVVGVYFPNCLQGFSVHADREQMSSLPEQFLLAGGFEAATAMIAYPDVLARDGNTPILDLASLQWQSGQSSLGFSAYGDGAYFGSWAGLGGAADDYAGGLVVLG